MIEQLIPRRKFRIQSKEFGNQWQTISYQKKASDVELEGGETVQHRIDNLVAKITELSTVIRNFKAQEGTDHDAFKRRIGLLYEQIRSGIGGVYNTFLTIEAEGEGAEDYNRLSGEFNTFQNQTRTKLTQLEADVEELLSYEPDAEGGAEKVDAYDYLDKLIDELEEYMSLVLTQLAQVIGDGDITDVLLNANVDITDQTDTSLAAALKIQHGKISGLETIMNQMGVGNPPYTWERYEYSSLDDPATCPVKVTAMTNTGDTTTYVPVWRVVFFYQPVFKLLKMTGYMGVSGTGTLDRSVYLSMDVETNKLRFFYTLLDNYERYQWINQDENGVISTVLDQYIDPRQGLLRNGYDSTTVLRVEQWSGLSLPSYYNFNYLGISMGDTGDTAYNPSGFSVWDSGLPEKPADTIEIVPWSSSDWDKKQQMLAAHKEGKINIYDHWNIGDKCAIYLPAITRNNGTDGTRPQYIDIVLVDKDIYYLSDSNEKCIFVWDMQDTLSSVNSFTMNSLSTNAGGWDQSTMRGWCNGSLYNSLPESFKTLIKQVEVPTTSGSKQTTIINSKDYCFLFSEIEIFGTSQYGSSDEGVHLEYYKTPKNRVKYSARRKETGNYTTHYWLRSPVLTGLKSFCAVNNSSSSSGVVTTVASRDAMYGFQPSVGGCI